MSNRFRNPFKVRASEKLEIESSFLKTYSPFILDALIEKNKEGKLWNDVLFLRSSPGAGKTSILKLFEPSCLLTLSYTQSSYQYKDIVDYLKNLKVVNERGVQLVGVYLSCARNYEVIEDLNISKGLKKRLFFALINARVILFSIRSIITLNQDISLNDIIFNISEYEYAYLDLPNPLTGKSLFDWASNVERKIFKLIDSFLPINDNDLEGNSELFSFNLMQPENITIKGKKLESNMLFMFDDVHKLSRQQRDSFLDYIVNKRGNTSIWIAERLEALEEEDNFKSYKNRDYNEVNLESMWRWSDPASTKLKKILSSIAEKRAQVSSEDVNAFQDFLEEEIREREYENLYISTHDECLKRINSIVEYNKRFSPWLDHILTLTKEKNLTYKELAIFSRQVEIVINRTIGKAQLMFDFPLSTEELLEKFNSDTENAALYFVSIENKIPYYHGFSDLVKLSSCNIDQFLAFSADLYELMLAKKVADKSIILSAAEQEKLLKKHAENKWREQSRLLPSSDNVLKFLQNVSNFSLKESKRASAPYAPGVNGFAIKERDNLTLIRNKEWEKDEIFKPLISVISTCLSFNLLEEKIIKQGKQEWTVYYLNRWICLLYNLPLQYGNWRPKSPSELLKWIR